MHLCTTADLAAMLTSRAVKTMLGMLAMSLHMLHVMSMMLESAATLLLGSLLDGRRASASINISGGLVVGHFALFDLAAVLTMRTMMLHRVMLHMSMNVVMLVSGVMLTLHDLASSKGSVLGLTK
jgi:hypothetical protein